MQRGKTLKQGLLNHLENISDFAGLLGCLQSIQSKTLQNWLLSSIKTQLKTTIESSKSNDYNTILSLHHNMLSIVNILPDVITQHIITFTQPKDRFDLFCVSKKFNELTLNSISNNENYSIVVMPRNYAQIEFNDTISKNLMLGKCNWETATKIMQKWKIRNLWFNSLKRETDIKQSLDIFCNHLCLTNIHSLKFGYTYAMFVAKFLARAMLHSFDQATILPKLKTLDFYRIYTSEKCGKCYHFFFQIQSAKSQNYSCFFFAQKK